MTLEGPPLRPRLLGGFRLLLATAFLRRFRLAEIGLRLLGQAAVVERRIAQIAALVGIGTLLEAAAFTIGGSLLGGRQIVVRGRLRGKRRTVVAVVLVLVGLGAQAVAHVFRAFDPLRIVLAGDGLLRR